MSARFLGGSIAVFASTAICVACGSGVAPAPPSQADATADAEGRAEGGRGDAANPGDAMEVPEGAGSDGDAAPTLDGAPTLDAGPDRIDASTWLDAGTDACYSGPVPNAGCCRTDRDCPTGTCCALPVCVYCGPP